MFFIFNKQKIYSYLVAASTVIILFILSFYFTNIDTEALETASETSKLVPIYNVDTEQKRISITINCAWNANDIDKILETLEKCNVKATFFMVGDWVEKYPEAVKKINQEGHEIGSHSDTHPHVNQLSSEENLEEIKTSSKKIEQITNKKVTLYRPPYGEYNNTVIKVANENSYIPIQWSLDTLDYTGITGNEMWNKIKDKISNGDIILMHNGTENTANSLDMILTNIKNKGYNIVPVSDLIYKENYSIDNNGVQYKQ